MISYLSSPKPFAGAADTNQRKAIASWLRVAEGVEVILYGEAEGAEGVAREMGVRHVPDVAVSASGTPVFPSIAAHAAREARHDLQVYLNCDILVGRELPDALRAVPFPQFLLIGQRLDLADGVSWDVEAADWRDGLSRLAADGRVTLHPPGGSDYFGFRRGLWRDAPPVVIGRAAYDNALIGFCLKRSVPVVDATWDVIALHPHHDYGHVRGDAGEIWDGEEAAANRALLGSGLIPLLSDAGWRLRGGRLERARCRGDWLRALELSVRLALGAHPVGDAIPGVARLLRAAGLSRGETVALPELLSRGRPARVTT